MYTVARPLEALRAKPGRTGATASCRACSGSFTPATGSRRAGTRLVARAGHPLLQARSSRAKYDRDVHDLGFIFMSTYYRWFQLTQDSVAARRAGGGRTNHGPAFPARKAISALVCLRRFAVHRHHDERRHHLLRGASRRGDPRLMDSRHAPLPHHAARPGAGRRLHRPRRHLRPGDRRVPPADHAPGLPRRFLLVARPGLGALRLRHRATATRAIRASSKPPRPAPTSTSPHSPPTAFRRGISTRREDTRGLVDTSAAAIAASGLLQLARLVPIP